MEDLSRTIRKSLLNNLALNILFILKKDFLLHKLKNHSFV
jgi:hypothetical protein